MVLLQLILKWYSNLKDFFLLDSVPFHNDNTTILKRDQSQYSDVRLISQSDIVKCFIYNTSAMPWRYLRRFRSDIVAISECPLGSGATIASIHYYQVTNTIKCNRIHLHFRNYIQLHCSLGEIIELINIVSIGVKIKYINIMRVFI